VKNEAERRVDNCFHRIVFLAKSMGAPSRLLEAIETERASARAIIRAMPPAVCGTGGGPRSGGTVEVGGQS